MTTLKEFVERLGGLHDAVVTRLAWLPEDQSLRIAIEDVCSNFEGLPEYPGATPGEIELNNVKQIRFEIDTSEKHLCIHDFTVEKIDATQYESAVTFWPSGRITVLHANASFPSVSLLTSKV